jgi:ABC-type nitrate/sulfonate/bicarbonate transport system ATPase subunit
LILLFKFRQTRTLAHEILNERFGALDAKVRKDLRRWIRRLYDEFHITSVFVTGLVKVALHFCEIRGSGLAITQFRG